MKPFPKTALTDDMRQLILKLQLMSGAQERQMWALWEWTRAAWWKGCVFGVLAGISFMVLAELVFG